MRCGCGNRGAVLSELAGGAFFRSHAAPLRRWDTRRSQAVGTVPGPGGGVASARRSFLAARARPPARSGAHPISRSGKEPLIVHEGCSTGRSIFERRWRSARVQTGTGQCATTASPCSARAFCFALRRNSGVPPASSSPEQSSPPYHSACHCLAHVWLALPPRPVDVD